MRKLRYFLLCLLLLNVACVKDYSTSADIEVNEVTISGVEKVYTIDLGSKLVIDPVIETKNGDMSKLNYIWYKYNTSMTIADTISLDKKLDVNINDVEPGVQNYLILKVLDNESGVYYTIKSSLYTNAKYSGGILALTKDNGVVDMAFVRSSNAEIITNLYSSTNPDVKLSTDANKIFFLDPAASNPSEFRRVVIATNDEKVGVVLTSDLLSMSEYVSDMFAIPLAKGKKYEINAYGQGSSGEMLIINGQLHDRPANGWTSKKTKFNPSVFSIGSPNYRIAPVLMQMDALYGESMFFDNVAGRFMYYEGESIFFYLTSGPSYVFSHFDPNALQGYEMVAAGTIADITEKSIGDWYSLMKNRQSGKYSILSFSFSVNEDYESDYKTLGNNEISQESCPMLYKATEILGGDTFTPATAYPWIYPRTGFAGMMFYLVNNSVYAYNVATNSEIMLIDGTASGFTIDKIVISKTAYTNSENLIAYEPRLGLCIRDNAAATKKGGVAYYRISGLGGISATQYFKKTGFCDQVIDFVEKLR